MKLQRLFLLLICIAFTARTPVVFAEDTGANYQPTKGKYEVATLRIEWRDQKRDRSVPVKIYYPKDAPGPVPLIVFSHGLGGSRDGYAYLGNEWASQGYISAHVQHLGSDTAALKTAMTGGLQEALKPVNASNRVIDIYFAINQLEQMNAAPGPLHGKIDMNNIGVAGHSYGAWTTLTVGGEKVIGRDGTKISPHHSDPRIKALIPMSAPVPGKADPDWAFGSITLPCFHMTGTLDNSPIAETKAADRRIPFDHMTAKAADEFLLTFNGGDHMVFSGRLSKRPSRVEHDPIFQKYIKDGSTAFWNAYLKSDHSAKAWLEDGGFKNYVAKEGTFETKRAK